MKKQSFDLSVYFIADPALCGERDIGAVVEAAVQGGASMVQYREKGSDLKSIAQQATLICDVVRTVADAQGRTVPVIINDYVDIAAEIGADGVHLGQGDCDPAAARTTLGPDAIIGWTAFEDAHFEVLKHMPPGTVDYIGTGPVYTTTTKKDKPVLGIDKFATLTARTSVPVVGIGGLTPNNATAVIKAGAAGVAMVTAISQADDPEITTQKFLTAVCGHTRL